MREFEQLYETYFGDVFRYLCRLSGSEHIAEELASDTFYRAMRSLDSFRGDCEVRVWLCRIAKNCYYSYLKKAKRVEQTAQPTLCELPDTAPSLSEAAAAANEAERIRKCLHTLSEPYKEVFMWRVYAEMSFKQIAEMFGKSENWACVTYHRARQMIKKGLEGSL